MGNLTALTMLWLSNNHLTVLPDSLRNLTALTDLYLDGNPLTELPDWLESRAPAPAPLRYRR
ncbi:leucine-rich repeat domain-containing protein [Micromonospora sp. NPDC047465]|uniref:leucine-rich repeat domain-containing protein n=1 Tax=Micromonospora sp. NPDC047465 TaxID=3154813 RepID=UPI0033D06C3F